MSTTRVEQSSWSRNRWILPVVLALLILAIVLGVLFRHQINQAFSSATATPTATPQPTKVVVVTATPGAPTPTPGGPTATPGGPTATPGGTGPATATPSSQGASTPLPNSTPVPTVVGLKVGMITRPQNRVTTIQAGADAKDPNYSFYLDPIQTVNKTLQEEGFTQGFQIVQPTSANPTPTPQTGADGRPLVKVVVRYQGKLYDVQVVQPGTHGPTGIWLIVSVLPHQ